MKNHRKIAIWVLTGIAVVCACVVIGYYWKEHQNQEVYTKIQEEVVKEKPEEEPAKEEFEIPIDFACACVVIGYYWKEHQNQEVYTKIQEEVVKEKPEEEPAKEEFEIPIDFAALQQINPDIYAWIQIDGTNIQYPIVQSPDDDSYYLAKEEFEIPIDFAALQQINPDIYAWIQIDGTNIQYPIVQSPDDDSYYLMRTVERQDGYPGSIYTERCNKKDFSDFNTLVYGHDMADGSMFQNLHNYSDEAYLDEHPYVVIYTPTQKLTYQIFASVVYDDRHIMNTFDFRFDSERQRDLSDLCVSGI